MARNARGTKSKQERVFEEFENTNKSIKRIAEEYGVAYTTCQKMLYRERKKRGLVKPRRQ